MHRCHAPEAGCRDHLGIGVPIIRVLQRHGGKNYGRVPWVVDSSAMSCTEITVRLPTASQVSSVDVCGRHWCVFREIPARRGRHKKVSETRGHRTRAPANQDELAVWHLPRAALQVLPEKRGVAEQGREYEESRTIKR